MDTAYRDLAQRPCMEISCRDLAKRSLAEIAAPQRERPDTRVVKTMFFGCTLVSATFCRGLWSTALPGKMSKVAVAGCHTQSSSASFLKPQWRQFHKTRLARPWHVLQNHQILRLPRKIASASTSDFDSWLPTCWQLAESVTPAKRMKKLPMPCTCHSKGRNAPKARRLPHKMDIGSVVSGTPFRASLPSKTEDRGTFAL